MYEKISTFHFRHGEFNLDLGLIETCYNFSYSAFIFYSQMKDSLVGSQRDFRLFLARDTEIVY